MKELYFFRHSLKDGPNNTCGPKGLALATAVGKKIWDKEDFNPEMVFHGSLTRTAQTALGFLQGMSESADWLIIPKIMPVVLEFGTDELFAQMVAPPSFRTIAAAMGNYTAVVQLHSMEQVKLWTAHCARGIMTAFAVMEDGECAVAFGHSPAIELAIAGLLGDLQAVPLEFQRLTEMEGILFQQDDDGKITAVRKISMPPDAT